MRELYALDPGITFLNHGSFGACPRAVLAAQRAWVDEMERNPVDFLGRRSAALLRAARERLAAFVGARADDLVFVPNATTGVNVVARSLDLRPGDEVLSTDLEYGACDATWQFVCARRGAVYRRVPVALPFDRGAFVATLAAAISARTRIVFVSHVASTTALVLPVAEVAAACRARGVPVLVDGAHAPGQLDLDLDAVGADYYCGNCHKWLGAPKGSGFLHARPEHQERLDASVVSWGYAAGSGGHTGFDAYLGRSVFERRLQWQGTRDPSAALAVPAAIEFHERHVGSAVRARCRALAAATMRRGAAQVGLPVIGSESDFAQMVPLPLPVTGDAETLRARLYERHRVEVPITQQGARRFARVSVHAYNDEGDIERLFAALAAEVGRG